MNMKKEIFKTLNKIDYSLKEGSIKTTKEAGLYGLSIKDCVCPTEKK